MSGETQSTALLDATQALLGERGEVALSVAVSAPRRALFAGTDRGRIGVWSTRFYRRERALDAHRRAVLALLLDDARARLYSSGAGGRLCVWALDAGGALLASLDGHAGSIFCLARLDTLAILGAQDATLKALPLSSLERSAPFSEVAALGATQRAHRGYVLALATAGERVFSGAGDGTIGVWRASGGGDKPQLTCERQLAAGHDGAVLALAVDDACLYSGGQDALLTVWDLETHYMTHQCRGHRADVLSIAVSRHFVFSGAADGELRAWRRGSMRSAGRVAQLDAPLLALTMAGTQLLAVIGRPNRDADDAAGGSATGIGATATDSVGDAEPPREIVRIWTVNEDEPATALGAPAALAAAAQHSAVTMPRSLSTVALVTSAATALPADQLASPPSGAAHASRSASAESALLSLLKQFCAIRTVSGAPQHAAECWRGARFLRSVFESFRFDARLVEGAKGKNPLVFARTPPLPDRPTVVFYGHYDVVGVEPEHESEWMYEPFAVTGVNGYLYGRGTSDNKGPLLAFAFAVRDLMARDALGVNVVFAIEGEEESKSAGFVDAVREHHSTWFANTDLVLLSNNYWLGEQRPCLTYGMRGLIVLRLTVDGPRKALHSGMDGGIVSEPLVELSALLGSLHDHATARVAVEHFYDDVAPMSASERRCYDDISEFDTTAYASDIGAPGVAPHVRDCAPNEVLVKRWREPSISVHSVDAAAAPSTIATRASAVLSVRFVPNQRGVDVVARVRRHIDETFARRNSANSCTLSVLRRGDWWLGDPDAPHYVAAAQAVETVWEQRPAMIREGGSIGAVPALARELDAPVLVLPLGQSSDSAHLPNERMRLENLYRGKLVFEELLANLAKAHTAADSAPQNETTEKAERKRNKSSSLKSSTASTTSKSKRRR